MKFTEVGRALLVHARLVVGQLARAQEEVAMLVDRQRAPLRIGIASWIALTCLGDVVNLFQQRMPDVRLEFFEGVLTVSIPKLRDGTLDFFIGRACPPSMHDDFAQVPLFRISSAVVAREGHPLAHCRSLAELRDAQWLLNWTPTDDLAQPGDAFSRYLREYAPPIHVAHSMVIAMSLIRSTDMLRLMAQTPLPGSVVPEMTSSMIEISTDVCHSALDVIAQLTPIRDALVKNADKLNIAVVGGGTHAFQQWHERRIYDKPRFREQIGRAHV